MTEIWFNADAFKRTRSVFHHENSSCKSCQKTKKNMVKVGSIFFCRKCYRNIFNGTDEDPVTNQREKYLLWLRK